VPGEGGLKVRHGIHDPAAATAEVGHPGRTGALPREQTGRKPSPLRTITS
jgi:hypothetical protein